ncbi:unannotated protein [freshwater metagenome]|uniref:Unannotated protein n=1 Tax=freshwater metagenome TaxID=449393 RepID=A0A6J7AQY7_9ZZZZ
MNPALSPTTTGSFPSPRANSATASTTSGEETTVRTISTKACTGAGLKKCRPTTCEGRPVATEISVTESDDVLLAKIACGGVMASRAANKALLISMLSGTASTTRSTSDKSLRLVVKVMRESSAMRSSSDNLPFATALVVEPSMVLTPRARSTSVVSTAQTCDPLRAMTSAIPAPMVPKPMTPTLVIEPDAEVVEELLMGGFCQLIRTVEDLDQRCPKARHNPRAHT